MLGSAHKGRLYSELRRWGQPRDLGLSHAARDFSVFCHSGGASASFQVMRADRSLLHIPWRAPRGEQSFTHLQLDVLPVYVHGGCGGDEQYLIRNRCSWWHPCNVCDVLVSVCHLCDRALAHTATVLPPSGGRVDLLLWYLRVRERWIDVHQLIDLLGLGDSLYSCQNLQFIVC